MGTNDKPPAMAAKTMVESAIGWWLSYRPGSDLYIIGLSLSEIDLPHDRATIAEIWDLIPLSTRIMINGVCRNVA